VKKTETNILPSVAEVLHAESMPDVSDAATAIIQRLEHDCARVDEIRREIGSLAPAYNKYRDLKADLEKRLQAIRKMAVLLGQERLMEATLNEDNDGTARQGYVVARDSGIMAELDEPTESLPLWEQIEQLLACVEQARPPDILAFFNSRGGSKRPKVTRQAVESAIKTHPDVFRIRKRDSERYLCLKDQAT